MTPSTVNTVPEASELNPLAENVTIAVCATGASLIVIDPLALTDAEVEVEVAEATVTLPEFSHRLKV